MKIIMLLIALFMAYNASVASAHCKDCEHGKKPNGESCDCSQKKKSKKTKPMGAEAAKPAATESTK